MAADSYDALAKVLRELPDRFGAAVFSDRRRVVSVLSDRVPEARREIKVLGSAIDDGVFDALSNARPEQIGLEIDRLAARIETNLGIRSDIALPVVRACAHGLGRGPLPSEYGMVAPAQPVSMPRQPDGSWVGGSAPAGGMPQAGMYPGGTPSAPIPRQPDGSWVGVSAPVGAPPQYGAPPPQYPPQGWPSSGPGMAPPPGSMYPGAPATPAKSGGWVKGLLIGIGAVVGTLVVLYIIGSTMEPSPPPPDPKPTTKPTGPGTTTPKTGPTGPTGPTDPTGPGTTSPKTAQPGTDPVTKPEREPTTPPSGPTTTTPQQPPSSPPSGSYAEESVDFGVAPQRTLQSNIGSPTPTSMPPGIGRILSTQALENEIRKGTDFLLVDVLENPHPRTLVKARYIPYGGRGGSFTDLAQQQLASELASLTNNRTNYPIVFFCAGVRCWESYNAVLRAYEAGYRNLYWYRGGIAAWTAAGLQTQPLGSR
ncbi:rhodanese-like domain-containing protein [Vineibacter terrae]|uniref:rhodanese-like domain-containing protein n=1 Tax=Vineibacter terrae TaxID=2586908 RepID=UPI002E380474|nr:rhodanese-like domain-containing protein [Vineibacter terrae]HEX2885545.1 rhodanese-like domain-containing protein [Vineibacter terrae]